MQQAIPHELLTLIVEFAFSDIEFQTVEEFFDYTKEFPDEWKYTAFSGGSGRSCWTCTVPPKTTVNMIHVSYNYPPVIIPDYNITLCDGLDAFVYGHGPLKALYKMQFKQNIKKILFSYNT